MQLHAPIPVLRIFDEAKAKSFYVDWLGFHIDWEHRFAPHMPLYFQITRDATTLHLTEHHGDCCPGSKVFININDAEALLADLRSRPYANMRPGIENAPWNAKIITVIDPFGNQLVFNQNLES